MPATGRVRRAVGIVALASVCAGGATACGADAHLQRQESKALALTCHSLVERDRVTPVPAVPSEPFLEAIREPPAATGGTTTRDLLVKVVCPQVTSPNEFSSLPFPWPRSLTGTTTTTTTPVVPASPTTATTTPGRP